MEMFLFLFAIAFYGAAVEKLVDVYETRKQRAMK